MSRSPLITPPEAPDSAAFLERVNNSHRVWCRTGVLLNFLAASLAGYSIIASAYITAYNADYPNLSRGLAAGVAVSTAFLSTFKMQKRRQNVWKAWRLVNDALLQREAGKASLEDIFKAYQAGDELYNQED